MARQVPKRVESAIFVSEPERLRVPPLILRVVTKCLKERFAALL